eukprot:scaffold1170_cov174-Amphora_coffeaeformis.AAC.32
MGGVEPSAKHDEEVIITRLARTLDARRFNGGYVIVSYQAKSWSIIGASQTRPILFLIMMILYSTFG